MVVHLRCSLWHDEEKQLELLTVKAASPNADLLPVRIRDASGKPCLLVLPSDAPSSRAEAAAAEAALHQMLADPAAAVKRAAAWRQQLLLGSSSAALLGLTADWVPAQNHPQQLRHQRSDALAGALAAGGVGALAGPAWLAAAPLASGPGVEAELVRAVRGTSSFLQRQGSGASSAAAASSAQPPAAAGGSGLAAAAAAALHKPAGSLAGASWQPPGTTRAC
jgi:hypothetical protein